MQALDPAGVYDDEAVIDALTGRYGTRLMRYRYDRLNAANTLIAPLEAVEESHAPQGGVPRRTTGVRTVSAVAKV